MKFVVDTVGTVTNPAGETFKGVILAVPDGTDEAEAARMMRFAASLWSERVEIHADL